MNNGPITYELDGKQYFGGGWRQLVVRFCLTKTKMITPRLSAGGVRRERAAARRRRLGCRVRGTRHRGGLHRQGPKAVFTYSMQGLRNEGAVRRADANGAGVIFEVLMLPSNTRYQACLSGTKAPSLLRRQRRHRGARDDRSGTERPGAKGQGYPSFPEHSPAN
jgi:hypothetical protein